MKKLCLIGSALCLAGCSASAPVAPVSQPTVLPVATTTPAPVIPTLPPTPIPTVVVEQPQTNQAPAAGSETYTPTGLVNLLGDGINSADTVEKIEKIGGVADRLEVRFRGEAQDLHNQGEHSQAELGPGSMASAMSRISQAAQQKRMALTDTSGMEVARMQGVEPEIMKAKIEAQQADKSGFTITISPTE